MLSEQDKAQAVGESLPEAPSSRSGVPSSRSGTPSSRSGAPSSRRVLIGFNHNVRYDDHIFHVQTEDMGRQAAYAITHVFDDQGRVVKTHKVSYGAILDSPDAKAKIRTIVRDQHLLVVEEVEQGYFGDGFSLPGVGGLGEPTVLREA